MKQEIPKLNNQSSIIDNQLEMPSTIVEKPLQINLFLQNKPNFLHFSTKNNDKAKKQTQYKPNQSQFWPNIKGGKAKTNPIKANLPAPQKQDEKCFEYLSIPDKLSGYMCYLR